MTKIYFREYYDRILWVIEGHSGFGEKGSDIVCAAVSAVSYTLFNTLRNEESDRRLRFIREIERDGYLCLEVEPFAYSRTRTDAINETCLTGFAMLADEYPEFVSIE